MIYRDGYTSKDFSHYKKYFLPIKARVHIYAEYISPIGSRARILSNSSFFKFNSLIDYERSVTNASLKGLILAQVRYGFPTGSKLKKVIDWGIEYSNDNVTTRSFNVKGKRRVGVWVKGRRGFLVNNKYKKIDEEVIEETLDDEGISSDSSLWQ